MEGARLSRRPLSLWAGQGNGLRVRGLDHVPGQIDNETAMLFWLLVTGTLLVAFAGKVRRIHLARLEPPAAPAALAAPEAGDLVAALLAGGLALILISTSIFQARPAGQSWALHLLSGMGILAFLLAGRGAAYGPLPGRLGWLRQRVAGWFGVRESQLVLLGLALPLSWLAYLAGGDRLHAWQPLTAALSWLLAIAAAFGGGYRREEATAIPRWEVGLALLLASVAFLLRGIGLEELPPTLSGDEASAGLEAVRFASGEANNLFGLGWFSFPTFYFAFQGAAVALLGNTATALRITSALAGALTVFALYWLARSLFGRATALMAAAFLAVFHYHVHFSRIGLQNIWDGFFVVVVLWGVWSSWKDGRRLPLLIAGLALGLGHYFYVSMRVAPLILLLWVGIAGLAQRARLRERLPDLLLGAYTALIVYLPLGLLFWRLPDEFFAPLRRVSVFNGWLENEVARLGQPALEIIAGQMQATALGLTHTPLRHWYNPGAPLLLPLAAALFIAGLAWLIYSADLRSLLLLLVLGALVVLGGLSLDAPASQRYVIAAPAAAIVVALPLAQGMAWLESAGRRARRTAAAAALLLMALVLLRDLDYYFNDVFDSYVLGGHNTETATAVARYLEPQPAATVYFFGLPRMGYASLSTIPYLAPQMTGHDVAEPLTAEATWALDGPALFIFLPERVGELAFVRSAYPAGRETRGVGQRADGTALFAVYEVIPGDQVRAAPP
jgi:4-amino-4-deoxy-L-arabinose transferase-like glycosyltransferase